MSSMPPGRLQSREKEIVRVLFDQHLLDRAVNLSEARWPGSGDMVRLAYFWPDLAPTERRQRLEDLGTEKLAEFRSLADLHPELAQVLEQLEAQGVLPSSAAQNVDSPPTDEPEAEAEMVEQPEPVTVDGASTGLEPDVSGVQDDWIPDDPALLKLEMPDLELGGESVEEFIASERERRAEAIAIGAETLERVRSRLDQTAQADEDAADGRPPHPMHGQPFEQVLDLIDERRHQA